jgi:hypothetical protein
MTTSVLENFKTLSGLRDQKIMPNAPNVIVTVWGEINEGIRRDVSLESHLWDELPVDDGCQTERIGSLTPTFRPQCHRPPDFDDTFEPGL